MVSHPKTGSDSPIGSDRDRGRDRDKSGRVGSISEKSVNSDGIISSIFEENPLKSIPSDIEKNLKQCMVVTLRSGKEPDEPKKVEKYEKQVEQKNMESEEKIEAEKYKEGVELNNKGKKQKSYEVVP